MTSSVRPGGLRSVACAAPGRLDFLGGVSDYSGSLVLEMPTQLLTSVALTPGKTYEACLVSPAYEDASLDLAPLLGLLRRDAPLAEFRAYLEEIRLPRWARYPVGCLIVLAIHLRWFPESGFALQIHSNVPDGQGVSSSAALEIATLRALNEAGALGLSSLELARLGQQAENLIVGASCGLMDQLAASCGRPGELLPIVCRPDTLRDPVPLPNGLMIAGWPSGVKHRVGASPYATARAASFMGKRIIETCASERWRYTSEIPFTTWRRFESPLPESILGADYLAAYVGTDDPLTKIDAGHSYPVRAATRFPIEENARAHRACEILANYTADPPFSAREMRTILKASHDAYSAMGLGCAETEQILDRILHEPIESGIIGGRISGGGSGGTVVVLLERTAENLLKKLAARAGHGTLIS
jgi:galactokinase